MVKVSPKTLFGAAENGYSGANHLFGVGQRLAPRSWAGREARAWPRDSAAIWWEAVPGAPWVAKTAARGWPALLLHLLVSGAFGVSSRRDFGVLAHGSDCSDKETVA